MKNNKSEENMTLKKVALISFLLTLVVGMLPVEWLNAALILAVTSLGVGSFVLWRKA